MRPKPSHSGHAPIGLFDENSAVVGSANAVAHREQLKRRSKSIAPTLISSGHFGADVAELFLHIAFIDLGGGGEARPQRMAGKFTPPLAFAQIAAHAGREGAGLDEPGDVPVAQPLDIDGSGIGQDASEQGPVADASEFHPGFQRDNGAGEGA